MVAMAAFSLHTYSMLQQWKERSQLALYGNVLSMPPCLVLRFSAMSHDMRWALRRVWFLVWALLYSRMLEERCWSRW